MRAAILENYMIGALSLINTSRKMKPGNTMLKIYKITQSIL